MEYDVCHTQTVEGLIGQHRGDQVLEVLREEPRLFAMLMSAPKFFRVQSCQQLVVRVVQRCVLERGATGVQHEENHADGEQIDTLGLVISA